MSDIIEEARRIVASARHYETIGGKFDGDDLENTAAIIDRLAAELEKARETIEDYVDKLAARSLTRKAVRK